MNARLRFALASVLLLVPASAAVDVQVLRDQFVRSTLKPATEVESYVISVPGGIRARAIAAAKAPRLRVGVGVANAGAAAPVPAASGRTRTAEIPSEAFTRDVRVAVGGDGVRTGDYELRVQWKVPRRLRFDRAAPANLDEPLVISAERGTRLRFRITGTDDLGGKIAPQLYGAAPVLDGGELELGATGDYVFGVWTPSYTYPPARYRVIVDVTPPVPSPRKIDLTDGRYGGRRHVSRVIGRDGGRLDVPELDTASNVSQDISGSAVDVPQLAVAVDTLFEIETGFGIDVPLPGLYSVGSAVLYRAEGKEFDRDVTTTIPFDASAFGGDPGKVRVFTRKDDGEILQISGVVIDLVRGTISFPTPHFSSFQVFGDAPVLRTLAGSGAATSRLRRATGTAVSYLSGTTLLEADLATGVLTAPQAPPARGAVADPGGGYIVATMSNQIVHAAPGGDLTILAGTGQSSTGGDGGPPLAAKMRPIDIALEQNGSILVLDAAAGALRRIDAGRTVITQVAALEGLRSVVLAPGGGVYVTTADGVWRLNGAGDAFDRVAGAAGGALLGAGDAGPLDAIRFGLVGDVSVSESADGVVVHVADTVRHCLWRLDLARNRGYIVAGIDGRPGFQGDAPAESPPGLFNSPSGIVWLGTGLDVAVLDDGNGRLRTLTSQ